MKQLRLAAQNQLISLLASIDGLFAPVRWSQTMDRPGAEVTIRRGRFQSYGLEQSTAGREGERKDAERAVRHLVSCGLVCRHRSRRRFLSFTRNGDDYARSLCNASTLAEAWPRLELVSHISAQFKGDGFVHETAILPDARNMADLSEFEIDVLPLLASGLLESTSDTLGAIGYRLTEAGRMALPAGPPEPCGDLPELDSRAEQQLTDAYMAALEERRTWKPERPQQIWIPQGAGSWPERTVDA